MEGDSQMLYKQDKNRCSKMFLPVVKMFLPVVKCASLSLFYHTRNTPNHLTVCFMISFCDLLIEVSSHLGVNQ
jgi:hypothetical protein